MKLRKYAAGAFITLATAGTLALAAPSHAADVTPTNSMCDVYITSANTALEQHQYYWSIGEFDKAENALRLHNYWMGLYNANC